MGFLDVEATLRKKGEEGMSYDNDDNDDSHDSNHAKSIQPTLPMANPTRLPSIVKRSTT